jgi:hypothetical protein
MKTDTNLHQSLNTLLTQLETATPNEFDRLFDILNFKMQQLFSKTMHDEWKSHREHRYLAEKLAKQKVQQLQADMRSFSTLIISTVTGTLQVAGGALTGGGIAISGQALSLIGQGGSSFSQATTAWNQGSVAGSQFELDTAKQERDHTKESESQQQQSRERNLRSSEEGLQRKHGTFREMASRG